MNTKDEDLLNIITDTNAVSSNDSESNENTSHTREEKSESGLRVTSTQLVIKLTLRKVRIS